MYFKWILFIVLTAISFVLLSNCNHKLRYISNSKLITIKEGWKGNSIIGNKFVNKDSIEKYSFFALLKWKFTRNPYAKEKASDTFKIETIKTTHFAHSKDDMIVWLGQCCFFIRINGKVIVTDPSYYGIPFKDRLADMPCKVSELKNVDYMLVSHNHMDHLNKKSVKEIINNNPDVKVLVPLKLNRFFESYTTNVEEAGWYQKYTTTDSINIILLPAHHWSRRGLFDGNNALWGSFIIQAKGKNIYFAADTRFDSHFEEIAKLFPNIDYALMPIGPFLPKNIMSVGHISPSESVKAINILKPKMFIPMHFGTYDQSWEPIGEPYRAIMKLQKEGKINSELKFVKIGEEVLL